MTDSIFINLQYLKANTSIQENVDGETIRPFIVLSMDKYILTTVGTALYNKLITDVKANTLTGNYLTLMQLYIQPTLAQYVMYEALPFINWQITNKAVVTKNSENSTASNKEDIIFLQAKIFDNANFYAQRFINYLRANYTLFPELNPATTDAATIFPAHTQYFSGIHLPNFPIGERLNRAANGDDTFHNHF